MGSEYADDLWIMANVDLPKNGFYLDLGCAWPEHFSNTAFLRKRGWKGLCIDANPLYAQDWRGVEEFVCMVIGDGTPVRFKYHDAPDLSRAGAGMWMPTMDLRTLLADFPPVDFISCDLEGGEMTALSTFPWEKQKPKVVISEKNTLGIGEDFRVREMLTAMGYTLANTNLANDILVFP